MSLKIINPDRISAQNIAGNVSIDAELNVLSENAVQNKVIAQAIDQTTEIIVTTTSEQPTGRERVNSFWEEIYE